MTRTAQALQLLRRTFSPTPGPGTPWPLFWFSFKNILLNRRKTPFLFLFLLVPLLITLVISGSLPGYRSSIDNDYAVTGGLVWTQDILYLFFFPLALPIVTAVYASAAIGEEAEGKTLPYLFTRPVYRSWILLAKALSFLLATTVLALTAVTATFLVAAGFTTNPLNHLDDLGAYWATTSLAVLATGGAFLLLGVATRAAVIIIVCYSFIWETLLSNIPIPGNILRFSFVFWERSYLFALLGRPMPPELRDSITFPSLPEAATVLALAGILGLAGSLLVVSARDYNV